MKKVHLITFVMTISMFNLFGQQKKESTKNLYKFKDSENTACIVCNHDLSKEQPILYAAHDAEADWQFLCGQDDQY